MKVILFIAMSLDGFIAREDGSEDFLSKENWDSMVDIISKTKNLIVGRNTYENNLIWPEERSLRGLKNIKKIVVSSDTGLKLIKGFDLATTPAQALEKLNKYSAATLIGGGTLNTSFAQGMLINEIIVNIEPVVITRGKKLFSNDNVDIKLELLSSKNITKRIIQMRYKVNA